MLLRFQCPACGSKFKVDARHAGRQGYCPNATCQQPFTVPAAPADEIIDDEPPPAPTFVKTKQTARKQEPALPRPAKKQEPTLPRLPKRLAELPARSVERKTEKRPKSKKKAAASGSVPSWMKYAAGGVGLLLGVVVVGALVQNSLADRRAGQPTAAVPVPVDSVQTVVAKKAGPDPEIHYREKVLPFLNKHCIDCHGPDEVNAELDIRDYPTFASVKKRSETWKRVVPMIEVGAMPPADHYSLPSDSERQEIVGWLDQQLFHVDCDLVDDPGRVTIRRLNRAEYDNTIRDLVGVDFEPAKDFPSDDVGYGFDNIGDVLTLPPLLLEKYLEAAEQIALRAIVIDTGKKISRRGDELQGNGNADNDGNFGLPSVGEAGAEFPVARAGQYRIRIQALANQAGPENAKMEIKLDGKVLQTVEIKGQREVGTFEVAATLEQGNARIAGRFINDYYEPKQRLDRNLYVRLIELEGPLNVDSDDHLPASHRRIVIAKPGKNKTVRDAAMEVFREFCRRAWRRPVLDEELTGIVQLVERVTAEEKSFPAGVQVGVQAVLVSPKFLFRLESHPQPNNPASEHQLNQYELATRLSYFLWSSMPDEELFRLAAQGTLSQRKTLEQQVQRMLKDPKAVALTENFAAQWLNLRMLDDFQPDGRRYRQFSPQLREDMKRETSLVFEAVVKEDRSILDFLDADFTFLNQRLAELYEIQGVSGDEFRKVSLRDTRRRGVLTHASILTLTSNPGRTSPVKRGKWIMENILGISPPSPPPNVPPLEDTQKSKPDLSLREQLAVHRENVVCASCHVMMDPIGLGFENFDVIGRWRDRDGKHLVDSSGVLPGGEKFQGPLELIQILKSRQDDFARIFTEKLLTYALGRGLEMYDECAVKEIAQAAGKEYRFSRLVTEIVLSRPFLMRRGDGKTDE